VPEIQHKIRYGTYLPVRREVERQGCPQIVPLPAEGVREPRKPAHLCGV
jgi:hypothetical protein